MLTNFKHKIIALSIIIACLNTSCKSGAGSSQLGKSAILKEKDFRELINPDSLIVKNGCKVEACLKDAKPLDHRDTCQAVQHRGNTSRSYGWL